MVDTCEEISKCRIQSDCRLNWLQLTIVASSQVRYHLQILQREGIFSIEVKITSPNVKFFGPRFCIANLIIHSGEDVRT